MKTKTSPLQDVKYTLHGHNKGVNTMKTFKHTPITNDDTDYFALSLIDRGLANTRALMIAEGLKENDWDKVASAICNCDCSNFRILYRIEERLMYLAIEKGHAKVIQDRINEIEEKVA